MRLRILRNIIKQGFQGMWRNRGMGLASVSSITAVLLILGLVLILVLSVNNVVIQTKNEFDGIQVYLYDNIDIETENSIQDSIVSLSGINSVEFFTKEEALEEMKEDWGDDAYLLEDLDPNPLQDSFKVKLSDPDQAKAIVAQIEELDGVEEVSSFQEIIENMIKLSKNVQIGGIIVIIVLVLISIFIISNTIKLTVMARSREIQIMKYVGATNGYIRGPFVIEGVLFGLIGAVLSILIINYGYQYVFNFVNNRMYAQDKLTKLLAEYFISPKTLLKDISIIFASIGAGIGALGSLVSIKRFLNV